MASSNFKIGDYVECVVNRSHFSGIVTTLKYIKSLAENSDILFLGPNLHDFIDLEGFIFVVMPNIYAAHVKEEYCKDPKYIGSYIVLPIHDVNVSKKVTDVNTRIYKEFFSD